MNSSKTTRRNFLNLVTGTVGSLAILPIFGKEKDDFKDLWVKEENIQMHTSDKENKARPYAHLYYTKGLACHFIVQMFDPAEHTLEEHNEFKAQLRKHKSLKYHYKIRGFKDNVELVGYTACLYPMSELLYNLRME